MTPRLKCGLAGAVLLVLGPLMIKWSIFDVLDQARAHAEKVSWSEKSIFFIPIAFFGGIAGLVCAAMPSLWVGFDPTRRRHFGDLEPAHKTLVIVSVVVLIAVSFGLRSWFLGELESLGYQV